MTRDEAIEILKAIYFLDEEKQKALNVAIEALDKPLPKPHERLMHWDTARRIIDSPRSKSQMLAVLDSVPPIEALERKPGEWIAYNGDDSNWLRNDGSPVFMQCSECNTMVVNNFAFNWNYCPNCGAKMDEKREDD